MFILLHFKYIIPNSTYWSITRCSTGNAIQLSYRDQLYSPNEPVYTDCCTDSTMVLQRRRLIYGTSTYANIQGTLCKPSNRAVCRFNLSTFYLLLYWLARLPQDIGDVRQQTCSYNNTANIGNEHYSCLYQQWYIQVQKSHPCNSDYKTKTSVCHLSMHFSSSKTMASEVLLQDSLRE